MDAASGTPSEQGQQEGVAEGLRVLRADFATVRAWMVKYEEWTQADAGEVGAAIAQAVKANDVGELAFWSEWMARFAEMAHAHAAQMDAMDQAAAAWWAEKQRRSA